MNDLGCVKEKVHILSSTCFQDYSSRPLMSDLNQAAW